MPNVITSGMQLLSNRWKSSSKLSETKNEASNAAGAEPDAGAFLGCSGSEGAAAGSEDAAAVDACADPDAASTAGSNWLAVLRFAQTGSTQELDEDQEQSEKEGDLERARLA